MSLRCRRLSGEVASHFRTSEIPADKILAFLMLATILMRLDTAFPMPLMYGVTSLAEASERHGDVDGVRKVPRNIFSAGAALIAVPFETAHYSFLPVGRIDLDLPTRFGVHPKLPAKSAGEHKCVDCVVVQDTETQIAVLWDFFEGEDRLPHRAI